MSMDAAAADLQLPLFFISGVSHDEGRLAVRIGNTSGAIGAFVFDRVESFWFFMESDHHELLATYEGSRLVAASDAPDCGVLRLTKSRLLEAYTHNGRSKAEAQAYLVATPQEYVEVVCLEPPIFSRD